ncbi:hypothetical protein PIB30_069765 [Stylosanthes scabra]|uniref:Transmembrane protein n=1 Tax=Stylosanthes scabra TaxID=79078 RepID=A0ABU6XP04_9FABA|nr:hypothetical protein [Stylosanthes scabra]
MGGKDWNVGTAWGWAREGVTALWLREGVRKRDKVGLGGRKERCWTALGARLGWARVVMGMIFLILKLFLWWLKVVVANILGRGFTDASHVGRKVMRVHRS